MKGAVIDQLTKEPLPGANVYASNSTGTPILPITGTTTDATGTFNFVPGSQFVTISYVGYGKMTAPNIPVFTIYELQPKTEELQTVTIKPRGITLLGFGLLMLSIFKLFKK
jgi:hypothetical protein